jgi:RND superfamily putative drug exporter
MARVAALATGHPRLIVVVWLALMSGLGLLGQGLEEDVSTRPIYVEGSAAERAHEIASREFGGEEALVVMLRGPKLAVDRQGRALVAGLQAVPRTLVISPWSSSGSIGGLRPRPGVAAVLVSIGQESEAPNADIVPLVRTQIAKTVSGPVRASVAGGPAVIDSLRASIKRATAFGELLAIPILIIVLLLVCRSILAAAIPVMVGGLMVSATQGVLDLCAGAIEIDSIAIGASAMFGLALGVDYSLLVISRFREEREKGREVDESVRTTVMATGRSIVPAGCALILAMVVSLTVLPGAIVISIGLAVVAATVLSVTSAMLLTPAVLVLLGAHLDRWSLPRRRERGSFALGWSRRLSGRPAVVLGLIFVLLLCGGWAFALDSNTGSVAQLPPDDPGRLQQENIERQLGPGWVAPFEVAVNADDGPITTAKRLDALADFQRKVERDPGVEAMAGFASIERTTRQLSAAERSFASQQKGLGRLGRGLAGAQDGAGASAAGFGRAAGGARELGTAIGQTRDGSGKLTDGLQATATGSSRLSGGLGKASAGSGKLTDATSKATAGAGHLAAAVQRARKQSAEAAGSTAPLKNALRSGEQALNTAPLADAERHLASAWEALQGMTAGRSDPRYSAALEAVREASREVSGTDPGSEEESAGAVAASLVHALNQFNLAQYLAVRQEKSGERAREGMSKLAAASTKLDHGLDKLLEHSRQLSGGLTRLSTQGQNLPPGLRRLTTGAERLLAGLGTIETGAGGLAGGLAGGAQKSQRLTAALGRLHSGVEDQQGSSSGGLQEKSPGLFRSGYFFLAGLDGSKPEQRRQAGFLVNIANGGGAARMLVIPKDGPSTAAIAATTDHLTADTAKLARETGAEAVVGGLPPSLIELNRTLRDEAPLARLVLSLVTMAIILAVTRSLALAILAALLNLLTVSATFGLLAILFDNSLLGGPGYVDTSVIPAVVILTFGLAIDYEVFIFARIREEYLRTGSTPVAIANGLGSTAHVISGAAMIMIAVFLAFSVSPLLAIRNLGVSQALGVFIDAFLIRFVILPATMRALGDRCWWLPRWLDRILPGGSRGAARPVLVGAEA